MNDSKNVKGKRIALLFFILAVVAVLYLTHHIGIKSIGTKLCCRTDAYALVCVPGVVKKVKISCRKHISCRKASLFLCKVLISQNADKHCRRLLLGNTSVRLKPVSALADDSDICKGVYISGIILCRGILGRFNIQKHSAAALCRSISADKAYQLCKILSGNRRGQIRPVKPVCPKSSKIFCRICADYLRTFVICGSLCSFCIFLRCRSRHYCRRSNHCKR